jgi:hypothetical protein
MQSKNRFPVTNIGTASLLMIFIVLCMVIFATLSLTDVTRDYSFSSKLADHTSQYYEASNEAEHILADIDELLIQTADQISAGTLSREDYYTSIRQSVEAEESMSAVPVTASYDGDYFILSYETKLNESLALSVALRVCAPDDAAAGGARYDIITWREIQTSEWSGDNTLNLMELE